MGIFSHIICWLKGHKWGETVPVWVSHEMYVLHVTVCERCGATIVEGEDEEIRGS